MNTDMGFSSSLGHLLADYVEYKRLQGYQFIAGEKNVRQFDSFVVASGQKPSALTRDIVESYIASRPGEKRITQTHRASHVRCLGKYLVRMGIEAYVLPEGMLAVKKYEFQPYVFSEGEIKHLMSALDSMRYCAVSPQRHIVIPMVIRMLYGCGLRISEALGLSIRDIDLQDGILFVRAAKFNKDRYVPMARSLAEQCRRYAEQVLAFSDDDSPFFPSPGRKAYGVCAVRDAFRQCLTVAGIPHSDEGPTLHSLRHSFAVHRLMRWSVEDGDVNVLLPYLSAYMGHENLLGTERYLRMTAEMFPETAERIRENCSWMMPEVDICENNN